MVVILFVYPAVACFTRRPIKKAREGPCPDACLGRPCQGCRGGVRTCTTRVIILRIIVSARTFVARFYRRARKARSSGFCLQMQMRRPQAGFRAFRRSTGPMIKQCRRAEIFPTRRQISQSISLQCETSLRPVDAGADHRLRDRFAVHILDLDLLGRRIRELEVVPERGLLLPVLDQALGEDTYRRRPARRSCSCRSASDWWRAPASCHRSPAPPRRYRRPQTDRWAALIAA